MRHFPHPVVLQQISEPQPRLWLIVVCFASVAWLPTALTAALTEWPWFSDLATAHDAAYHVAFFFVQSTLVCGAVAFLSWKYAPAIWKPQPSLWRGAMVSLVILLPLALFYLPECFIIPGKVTILNSGAESAKMLASIHEETWGKLAYGSSLAGVVCGSCMAFASPVLEETVFSGFISNAIARKYGFASAAVGAPALFALVHGIPFGFRSQLIPLFFAGVIYTVIRFYSGSLLFAILAHWTINALIFLPKWVIAYIYFTRTGN